MRFKMWRRKNKVFLRYVMVKEDVNLFRPPFSEVRAEEVVFQFSYAFRGEEEAKEMMNFKNFFTNLPLAVQQTLPKEKLVEACLKASELMKGG